jgi:hypothetical protein
MGFYLLTITRSSSGGNCKCQELVGCGIENKKWGSTSTCCTDGMTQEEAIAGVDNFDGIILVSNEIKRIAAL